MSFTVPTMAEIRTQIITALRNAIANIDTSTHGDEYRKAGAIGHVIEGIYKRLKWVVDQVFPGSATFENLKRHAFETYGLPEVAPNEAEGEVEFTGIAATVIPLGQKFTKADGWEYETTAADVISGGGNVVIAAIATSAGADGNCEAGEEFTVTSPPAGCDSTATADSDFVGGTDDETAAELLDRLLARIQEPPAGGNEDDWEAWCLEVSGVEEAFVFPEWRGPGTVAVVVFTDDVDGNRAQPGAALISAVETYLESKRPVTSKAFYVVEADEVTVDVTYTGFVVDEDEGYDPATQAAAGDAALEAAFPTFAPGETLYPETQLDTVLADVPGVLDFTRTTPAAPVEPTVDSTTIEVLVAGVMTVTPA